MKNIVCILLLSLLLFSEFANSQVCDCNKTFDSLRSFFKSNYIGYYSNDVKKNQKHFIRFTDSLKRKAWKADELECYHLMRKWVEFFRDEHTALSYKDESVLDEWIIKYKARFESVNIDSLRLITLLKNLELDSLTGFWYDSRKRIKIAVIKKNRNSREYIGFVVQSTSKYWHQGQVKFKLERLKDGSFRTVVFYPNDHRREVPNLSISKGEMLFIGFGRYIKEGSNFNQNANQPSFSSSTSQSLRPTFQQSTDSICTVIIPSFLSEYKNSIDSLFDSNHSRITQSNVLIIDIRGNGGGTTIAYQKILPLLYTNPILSEGGDLLCGPEIIKNWKRVLETSNLTNEERAFQGNAIALMEANRGKIISIYPREKIEFDTILPGPKRVFFIVDRNTASAAELLLLAAKQSKKVNLFGENTAGVVDFLDVNNGPELPCRKYSFFYASVRRSLDFTGPIDHLGITPDILIPKNTKEWNRFCIDYAERTMK